MKKSGTAERTQLRRQVMRWSTCAVGRFWQKMVNGTCCVHRSYTEWGKVRSAYSTHWCGQTINAPQVEIRYWGHQAFGFRYRHAAVLFFKQWLVYRKFFNEYAVKYPRKRKLGRLPLSKTLWSCTHGTAVVTRQRDWRFSNMPRGHGVLSKQQCVCRSSDGQQINVS
jgi:hypothetical protein